MTQPPHSDPSSSDSADSSPADGSSSPVPSSPGHQRRSPLGRVALITGATLTVAGMAGAVAARQWVYTRLVPTVESSLENLMQRPIEVGDVEGFTPFSIRLGETVLPPTSTDSDRAVIDALQVRFNPLEVLFKRQLSLGVTLIRPRVVIEQSDTGSWVDTEFQPQEPGAIEIKLDRVRVQDAQVAFVPYSDAENADPLSSDVGNLGIENPALEPGGASLESSQTLTQAAALPPTWSQPQLWPPVSERAVAIAPIDGVVRFRDENRRFIFDLTGQPWVDPELTGDTGGEFELEGELFLGDQTPSGAFDLNALEAKAMIRSQNLAIAPVTSLLPNLPATVPAGRLHSQLEVSIAPNFRWDVLGTARFEDLEAEVAGLPFGLSDGGGQVRFRGGIAQLDGVSAQIGATPFEARGQIRYRDSLSPGYDLLVEGRSLDLAELAETAALDLPVAIDGQVNTEIQITGALDEPQIEGTINQVRPIQVDQVAIDTLGARFQITPHALEPTAVEVNAFQAVLSQGGVIAGTGRLGLTPVQDLDFSFDLSDLSADALVRPYLAQPLPEGVNLGNLTATLAIAGTLQSPRANVSWALPQATYPAQGEVQLLGDRLQLRNTTVEVLAGTVQPEAEINLRDRQWQAVARLNQVPLRPFLREQSGDVSGLVQASGSLNDLSLPAIDAEGQIRLSSIPVLAEPLTADFRWVGNGIELREATTPSFRASGFIAIQIEEGNIPSISQLDLDVQTETIDIQRAIAFLPASLPANVQITGQTRFAGKVTGTPSTPTLDGNLALNNLVVNDVAFDPTLAGRAQFTLGDGGRLDLTGGQDRIALAVDAQYRPVTFLVRQGSSVAEGRTEGDRLITQLTNFPLAVLNLRPAPETGLGRVAGAVSGRITVNLETFNLADPTSINAFGNVEIRNPRVGHIEGDFFQGRLIYEDGIVALNGGQLRVGDSTYALVGRLSPTDDTLFRGQLSATNGGIQDLLVALQYFELTDILRLLSPPTYGMASDVESMAIATSDSSLLRQLQRYSEIAELRERQLAEAEQTEFFPPLRDLSGDFSGIIDIIVDRDAGLSAEFSVEGEDWQWGNYDAPNRLIAEGSFADNTLTLLPFRFESGDTLINFAGQVGQDEDSSGQVRVENVPAELVMDFFQLPLDIQGSLNATATITESISNPQARGVFELTDGRLNQTLVQQARAGFSYSDARLNLIGGMRVTENDPIRLTGSIPYRLPQGTVAPASDEISLEVQLENDGMAILNVFSDQLAWEGGEAAIALNIGGTLRQTPTGIDLQPLVRGRAQIQNGRFSSRLLPEPLTDVSGTVLFNRDRINVEGIQGLFSDGEFMAQGVVPLAQPLAELEPQPQVSPLTVSLSGLAVNFKGLYNGGVDGLIQVGGTALAPQLGGEVVLSDGRISLPDTTALPRVVASGSDVAQGAALFSPPELNNLQVTLGDRLLITRAPILNFVATGGLVVNGSLNDFQTLRPDGIIRLRSGQVNVFTTQFNLVRGRDNIAVFSPSNGADPFLNVRLATSVLEQTRTIQSPASPYAQSEIVDTTASDIGGLQTVRIEAEVNGPASQIFENLELTSSPGRSENEIIALIGGGFVNNIDEGDGSLAIANLAGTALFTSIQTLISNAVGFGDFRIFPTVITDDEREESSSDDVSSTFGLAAELGIEITDDLSVSILQLLTVREPTQFSLRYRLDDNWLLRGSTNLNDENRVVLEYEARF
ncbi:MAG: translocation/assembly module TamB domain-containing protein [Elainellaceae cyanobacterium]